jgi:hypothetical protein
MRIAKEAIRVSVILFVLLVALKLAGAAPYFDPDPDGTTFNATQGVLFTYDVNATDPNNDTLNFTDDTDLFDIDILTGLINFTPTNDDVGNYTGSNNIALIVKNSTGGADVAFVNFIIYNVNDLPNITSYYPTTLFINTTENVSGGIYFNYSAEDPDIIHGDSLNATWYIDGIFWNSSNTSFVYYPGFCDAGVHNISVIVSDNDNASTSMNWTVNVSNVNRPPALNGTIQNVTWVEDNNLTDNLTLSIYFYDLDYRECGGEEENISYSVTGNTNITIVINQTTSNVSFYPDRDFFGEENVIFTANDSYSTTNSNTVTLNVTPVNDPPVLSFIENQVATKGIPFYLQITAIDVDGDYLSFSDNSTFFNVTNIDGNTGEINFTPSEDDIGVHYVNISVNDSTVYDYQIVVFTIGNNTPPSLTPIGDQTAIEGVAYNLYVYASDIDLDNLTFDDNSTVFDIQTINSSGVNATGLISFTPTESDVGNYSVTIKVNDTRGAEDYEIIDFNISGVNNPPELDAIPDQYLKVNISFTYDVDATDADNDTLYFGDNATFFNITQSTGLINFTPISADIGVYDVNISVNDSVNTDSQVVTFTISINNKPRIIDIANQTATEDELFTLFILGEDDDSDTLTFDTNSTLFNITPYNSTAGLISVTFNITEVGNYSIEVNVSDGYGGFNSTNFTLNISGKNDIPYFVNLTNQTIYEDSLTLMNVTAYDEEGDTLTIDSNSSMFNITMLNATTGLINFTPRQRHVGNHTINLSVTDGQNTTYETVVFTVVNVNDPPVIVSYVPNITNVSVIENSSILFNLTNVTDEDGDTLWYIWYLDGVNQSGNQSWLYRPNLTAAGNYNVTAVVLDPYSATDSKFWNLTVNNTNRVPVFNRSIQNITWLEDTNLTENITLDEYFYDLDGDDINYTVMGNVNITIVINQTTSNVSFYPDTDFYGVEYIVFVANDSYNSTYSNNVTLNITPVNDAPVLGVIPNQSRQVGELVTIQVNAIDPDNDSVYYSTNTTYFTISNTGLINFTVPSSMVGNNTINISVNDTQFVTSRLVLFEINGTNIPPNITNIYPYGKPVSSLTVFSWINRSQFANNVTTINASENETVLFNVTVHDEDNDPIIYNWYFNGTLVSQNGSWQFNIGFSDNGTKNVSLKVSDGKSGNEDTFTWNVTVNNTNRIPRYGMRIFTEQANFSAGINNNTNVTEQTGNITLQMQTNVSYYPSGNFTSVVIDFGDDIIKPFLRNISWKANIPNGTNITFKTRTSSNGYTWDGWRDVYGNSTAAKEINFSNSSVQLITGTWSNRYFQYMALLTTTNTAITPVLEEVTLRYEIPNFQFNEEQNVPDWVDLDDYFSDSDPEDYLNYSVELVYNADYLGILVNNKTGVVSFSPAVDWYGAAEIQLCAKDSGEANTIKVCSQVIEIFVNDTYDSPATPMTTSTGGGGTSRNVIIRKTRIQNVTQPVYLELIVPQPLIISPNNTIIAPIRLQNNGNISINKISLAAFTNESNITLEFEEDYFKELLPGTSTMTELIIRIGREIGSFQINLTAISEEPEYQDSAIILVNSLPNLNQSIKFVRDLLSTNPECLELYELLEDAKRSVEQGQYGKARTLLDNAIQGCRYLISARREIKIEAPKQSMLVGFIIRNKIPLIVLLIVTILFIIGSLIFVKIQTRK